LKSTGVVGIALIFIVLVAGVYLGITYPKTTAAIEVSFSAGVDSKTVPFEQMYLNEQVEVQVAVQNGAALWRAQILSGDEVVWTHSAAQGSQQSYNSGWVSLPRGSYNFTFGTVGVGSLDATATVTSKGGVW